MLLSKNRFFDFWMNPLKNLRFMHIWFHTLTRKCCTLNGWSKNHNFTQSWYLLSYCTQLAACLKTNLVFFWRKIAKCFKSHCSKLDVETLFSFCREHCTALTKCTADSGLTSGGAGPRPSSRPVSNKCFECNFPSVTFPWYMAACRLQIRGLPGPRQAPAALIWF